jgi:hypothetical protein
MYNIGSCHEGDLHRPMQGPLRLRQSGSTVRCDEQTPVASDGVEGRVAPHNSVGTHQTLRGA